MKNEETKHALHGIEVLDVGGSPVRLESLWADRPVALVFVRHFGCLFCQQQVDALQKARERLERDGARVVVIGQGSPEDAREFRDANGVTLPLYVDPSRASYCAVGLKRGFWSTLGPGAVARAVSALTSGYRQRRSSGDVLQQGGVVVMGPGGREFYRYASREAGDHPSIGKLQRVLDVAARQPAPRGGPARAA